MAGNNFTKVSEGASYIVFYASRKEELAVFSTKGHYIGLLTSEESYGKFLLRLEGGIRFPCEMSAIGEALSELSNHEARINELLQKYRK